MDLQIGRSVFCAPKAGMHKKVKGQNADHFPILEKYESGLMKILVIYFFSFLVIIIRPERRYIIDKSIIKKINYLWKVRK